MASELEPHPVTCIESPSCEVQRDIKQSHRNPPQAIHHLGNVVAEQSRHTTAQVQLAKAVHLIRPDVQSMLYSEVGAIYLVEQNDAIKCQSEDKRSKHEAWHGFCPSLNIKYTHIGTFFKNTLKWHLKTI